MNFYRQLDEKQKEAVNLVLKKKTVGIFAEPRTGKTWIAGSVIEEVDAKLTLLITLEVNKYTTWDEFLRKYLVDFEVFDDLEKFDKSSHTNKILLIHWEQIGNRNKKAKSLVGKLSRRKWGLIIADEIHRAKDESSVTSRAIAKLSDTGAEYKVGLTGTPWDDNYVQLFGQFRFIKPDLLGDWSDFKDEFCRRGGWMKKKWLVKRHKKNVLIDKLSPYIFDYTQKEAGILPAILKPVYIKLLGEQRETYDQLEQKLVLEFEDSELIADLPIVLLIKLHQIAQGFVREERMLGDDEIEIIDHEVGRAKERVLVELMKKHKPPLVVFCRYRRDIDRVVELATSKLGFKRIGVLDARTKDTKRNRSRTDLINSFKAGELELLVCQVRTGGVGIDLWAATACFVYSFWHSFIDFDQLLSRVLHRMRKESPVVYVLLAEDSVDIDVYESIQCKQSVKRAFWERVKRNSKRRK